MKLPYSSQVTLLMSGALSSIRIFWCTLFYSYLFKQQSSISFSLNSIYSKELDIERSIKDNVGEERKRL